jgi:hypothetical protein
MLLIAVEDAELWESAVPGSQALIATRCSAAVVVSSAPVVSTARWHYVLLLQRAISHHDSGHTTYIPVTRVTIVGFQYFFTMFETANQQVYNIYLHYIFINLPTYLYYTNNYE